LLWISDKAVVFRQTLSSVCADWIYMIIVEILSQQSLRQAKSRFKPDGNEINQPKNKISVYPSDLGVTSYVLFRKHPVIAKQIRRRICKKTVRLRQKRTST
jgi:hypothetical protein